MTKVYFDFGIHKRTLICHELAKYWKEKYGINNFAGMVAVKNGKHLDFLKNQKEIEYRFIDNRDEIEKEALKSKVNVKRIEEIERELDIPLWHFIVADRNIGCFFVKGAAMPKTTIMELSSHKNIIKWIVYYYDLISKRMEDYNPDAVVFLSNASMPSLILAKICEMKNIPYYVLISSRIENFNSIVKNNYRWIDFDAIADFEKILKSEKPEEHISQFASKYVDLFNNKPKKPDYAEIEHNSFKNIFKTSILRVALENFLVIVKSALSNFGKKHDNSNLREKNKISNMIFKLRKNFIAKKTSKIFNDDINPDDKYVFFPLHLDPEASTMILAPNFVNQLNLIELLAKNIPMSHKLYIKEHIPNIGTRPKNFYKEIKKYPNVKLISPWADSFNLIKKSSLVATISGTAGWEAILMNIPVLTFSETFYSKAGLASYCSDVDKLGKIIKKMIYEKDKISKEEKTIKVKVLVTAIINNSFRANENDLIWGKKNLIESKHDIARIASEFYMAFNK